MNAVNRVLIVILLLVAMVLCSVLLVTPVRVLSAVGQQSVALVDFLNSMRVFVRAGLGILFAAVLDIILVLFLIAEVRRPVQKAIRVKTTSGGEVQVSVNSIADRLKYEIDQLSSILRTKPQVLAKRGGVVVELDVETAAEIDVPQKAEQIVETARRVVEEKMGLKLARPPKVNLRAVPYPSTPSKPKISAPAVPEIAPDTAPEE
ncbi:MAG TPA: hypothetical protein VMY40_05310 [Anaerolineae bacterium]|nr:hypothetical protein [Anaerolineae bacterium]